MAAPQDASMPAGLDLGPGFTLRVTALAVSDGSVVSAVKVSNFGVMVDGASADALAATIDSENPGPYMLVLGPNA